MKQKFRKGVFIVIYSFEKYEPIYLLLKRKLHWVGWEFPKGGIEKFETKMQALKREAKEETSLKILKIKKHKFSGKYSYPKLLKDRPGFVGQTFTLYSAQVKKGKVKLDKKEHSSYRWLHYKDALKTLTHKNQKDSLKIVNDRLKSKLK